MSTFYERSQPWVGSKSEWSVESMEVPRVPLSPWSSAQAQVGFIFGPKTHKVSDNTSEDSLCTLGLR